MSLGLKIGFDGLVLSAGLVGIVVVRGEQVEALLLPFEVVETVKFVGWLRDLNVIATTAALLVLEAASVETILEQGLVSVLMVVLSVPQPMRCKRHSPAKDARQQQDQLAYKHDLLSHQQQKTDEDGQDQRQIEFEPE